MATINVRLRLTDAARRDIERLDTLAQRDPSGQQRELLESVVLMLHGLAKTRHPTKFLEYDSRFGDLSDCETTYVGADPNEKPPIRIVTRDMPAAHPGGPALREVIAIGPRQDSVVYHAAAGRLGRHPGVTLDELNAANPQPTAKRKPVFDFDDVPQPGEDTFQR
ncbi:MAG: hypothetical protein ABWX92_11975 [Mycetocola sp.]